MKEITRTTYDEFYDVDFSAREITAIRDLLKKQVKDYYAEGVVPDGQLDNDNFQLIGLTLAHAETFRLCFAMALLRLLRGSRGPEYLELTGREIIALRFCASAERSPFAHEAIVRATYHIHF